jgi:hypothetical protein
MSNFSIESYIQSGCENEMFYNRTKL